jgi:hypothetical protein
MPRNQPKKVTKPAPWTPPDIRPGPELIALSRFLWDGTWTGTVEAEGMGPGSPEMDGKGKAICERIMDGLWISCRFTQDQFIKGKKILTWNARFIAGWDVQAQEYRAVGVDSNGSAFMFRGVIKGDQLIMESMGEGPVRIRFTWDATDPTAMTWKNEISLGGGPWTLIEEYTLYPT